MFPFLGELLSIIFAFSVHGLFAFEEKECINFQKSSNLRQSKFFDGFSSGSKLDKDAPAALGPVLDFRDQHIKSFGTAAVTDF